MQTPGESHEVDGLQVYAYVSRLRADGATPLEIQQKLIENGLDPERAIALVDRLVAADEKKEIRARAFRLLSEGTAAEELKTRLINQGFDPGLVDPVVDELLQERKRDELEQKGSPRALWRTVGIVLLILGIVLLGGNMSRLFPTFSFAGTIVMGVGLLVFMMGSLGEKS
jgi:hypothetical protein